MANFIFKAYKDSVVVTYVERHTNGNKTKTPIKITPTGKAINENKKDILQFLLKHSLYKAGNGFYLAGKVEDINDVKASTGQTDEDPMNELSKLDTTKLQSSGVKQESKFVCDGKTINEVIDFLKENGFEKLSSLRTKTAIMDYCAANGVTLTNFE